MSENRGARRSNRANFAFAAFVIGAALLAVMPLVYLFLAFSGTRDVDLSGTLMILTSTAGMILVVIGAALRE